MRRLTHRVPTAISLLALFLALGGTALAAKHYLITSTHQIKPSVLSALKGKTGKTGPAGVKGETGPRGEPGARGETGGKGERGEAGANGAVAGYSATQGSVGTSITNDASLTQIPNLTKALPAGSFIASATINLSAIAPPHEHEYASAECVLADKTTGATEVSTNGEWTGETISSLATPLAAGQISLELPLSGPEASTLGLKCRETGLGEHVELQASKGSLVAVQTTENK